MNILLINENPVVSRLLTLCTREDHMALEEVSDVDTIQHENYTVIFVDESSYKGEVLNLSQILTADKKVFLSNSNSEMHDFDMTIKKPFLPSQIIEILENIEKVDDTLKTIEEDSASIFPLSTEKDIVEDEKEVLEDIVFEKELDIDLESKISEEEKKEDEVVVSDTQVLDIDELEKIKALLDMDDKTEESDKLLSDEEIEQRKVEVIKEQLIADGLEIVDEEEIVEELSAEDNIVVFSEEQIDKKKPKKKKASKNKDKKSTKKKKKKSIAFTEEELERIEDAVQVAIATLKRKQMKKLLKGKEIEVLIQLEGNN